MGNKLITSTASSAQNEPSSLLDAALNGELDRVKKQVGIFLATTNNNNSNNEPSNDVKPVPDPRLVAFVDAQDANGNAAIHGAAFGGHVDVIQFLHSSCGASLELKNNLGCSPLWLAAGYNRPQVFTYVWQQLQKQNDSPATATEENCNVLQLPLLTTNSTGDSILLAAASRGHTDMVQTILQAANATTSLTLKCQANRSGDTPLNVAMAGDFHTDDKLMNLLMDSSIVHRTNEKGVSPILMACERDWSLLLERLLELHQSKEGEPTPANVVVGGTDVACLSTPQPPTTAQPTFQSLIGMAAFCGSDNVMSMLINRQRLQQQDDAPLSLPEQLNQANSPDGATPHWLSARAGHTACVKLLLEAGADPTIANRKGITPLAIAIKHKRVDIINLLQPQLQAPEPPM